MTSPWLDMYEAAVYLRFLKADHETPAIANCLRFIDEHHIPTKRRGRTVLVHRDDLDAALEVRTVGAPRRRARVA